MNFIMKTTNYNTQKMKTTRLFLLMVFFVTSGSLFAQYGIGTQNPNEAAALEIKSPDKGVLIPRLALTSSTTFLSSATASTTHNGMIVYNTSTATTNGLSGAGIYVWKQTTASNGAWEKFTTTADDSGLADGTTTNSTLYWNGTSWVENTAFLTDGSTTTTVTTALSVTGATTLASASLSGNLTVDGTSTLTGNVTAGGTLGVTGDITASANVGVTGALTVTGATTLNGALVDSAGNTGSNGQLLASNGSGQTQWVDPDLPVLSTITATGAVAAGVSILLINSGSADITATLNAAAVTGHTIKIRRNFDYTGTSDNVTIDAGSGNTINGQQTKSLNVGFQSVTLVKISATAWVSID